MKESIVVADCGTCRANHGLLKTPGVVIYDDGVWRLEHIVEPIPMAGWLALKPWHHVETMADLTKDESASFGRLSRRIVVAMNKVMRPQKVYVCLFAEAENFAHIHFHLIPRLPSTPADRRGPAAFEYLREAAQQGRNLADVNEAARVATEIRGLLSH